MTHQEQNNAIASILGWTQIHESGLLVAGGSWFGYPPVFTIGELDSIPDYCGNLNRMFQLEETLTEVQKSIYGETLAAVLGYYDDYYDGWGISASDIFEIAHATAAQRAKAFLKVHGKWKE